MTGWSNGYLEVINIFLLVSISGEELIVLGGEIEIVEAGEEEHEEECQGQVGRVGEDWTMNKSLHSPLTLDFSLSTDDKVLPNMVSRSKESFLNNCQGNIEPG